MQLVLRAGLWVVSTWVVTLNKGMEIIECTHFEQLENS